MCGRTDRRPGQLYVRVFPKEVRCKSLLALVTKEAGQTATHGLPLDQETLSSILAV